MVRQWVRPRQRQQRIRNRLIQEMKIKLTIIIGNIIFSHLAISDDLSTIKIDVEKSKSEFLARNKSGHDSTSLKKICEKLSSEDIDDVLSAVAQLKELKENKLLLIALRYPSGRVQIQATQALRETGDRSTVSELISSLVAANEDPLKGGSETVLLNRKLKEELIGAIVKFSDVRYEGSNSYEATEVNQFTIKLKQAGFATKEKKSDAKSKTESNK